MTDTFNAAWIPLVGPSGTGTLRARKVQFGDGYRQRSADGPVASTHMQSWPLSWIGQQGAADDVLPIRDFLVAHVGQTFYWTPPGGVQGNYACETYTLVPMGIGRYQLTATFDQDYKP
jgi:phage-related protein